MTTLEERAAKMQSKYLLEKAELEAAKQSQQLKESLLASLAQEEDEVQNMDQYENRQTEEMSFVDESKITYNVDEEGFSSLGESSGDDAAEAEAI